ncbi:hypothetical protein R6G99_07375, partial [Actinotignum timonense]|nr:hypothetical protein [Actinotignum timonense]
MAAGTLPSAPFYIAAGLCLLLSLWCTVVGAALGRMTRTEAAEMYAHKERGSARVVAIMGTFARTARSRRYLSPGPSFSLA